MIRISTIFAVLLICNPVLAVPIVDGKFDSTEGYSLGFEVDFRVEGQGLIEGGKLYFGTDKTGTGDHYLYFSMPTNFVDNSYGIHEIGWDNKPHKVKHKFKSLLGSDGLGRGDPFVLKTLSGDLELTVDYIARDTGGDKKGPVIDYRSGGIGTGPDSDLEKNEGDVEGGDGDPSGVKEIATSLEYNIDRYASADDIANGTGVIEDSPEASLDADGNYIVADPFYNDWIWEIGYEFRFDADLFDLDAWTDRTLATSFLYLGEAHVSPAKDKFITTRIGECIFGPRCFPTKVPEPTSLLLLAIGLLGFLGIGWPVTGGKQHS